MKFCLGLMSGTSMDGIDAALLATDGHANIQSYGGSFFAYPRIFQILLKAAELAAQQAQGDILLAEQLFPHSWLDYTASLQIQGAALTALEQEAYQYLQEQLAAECSVLSLTAIIQCSTQLHYVACIQLMKHLCLEMRDVEVIGYHGQTLYHNPQQGISWQAGDPQRLANDLNTTVISHFRANDVAHGGQGAPLTPLYHHRLVTKDGLYPAAVINCGGIANVSVVLSENIADLSAFDAGPGNVLLDRFISQATLGAKRYDQDGQLALRGSISAPFLALLHTQALPVNFLKQAPPKSLDSHDCLLPEAFHQLSLEDGLATLAAFTAECLVLSLMKVCPPTQPLKHIILAGGGWYHPVILNEFKQRLSSHLSALIQISTANQLGWQQDLLEAEAFAYLAKRSLLGLSLSTPLTTGVLVAQTGGHCFHPQPLMSL